MNKPKQVIVIRRDIQMSLGKSCAQVAHASLKAILSVFKKEPHKYRFRNDKDANTHFALQMEDWEKARDFMLKKADMKSFCYDKEFEVDDPVLQWLQGDFTKIVVECKDLDELLELESKAKEKGLITALIKDNGLTEFKEECPNCEGNGNRKWGCATCNDTGRINKPTITCLAIGPDWSDKVDEITGHLKLR